MISGFERYYQVAKCFRDEDLRADRQPEFTQIDMEMSFIEEKDIMGVTEGLLRKVFKEINNINLPDKIMHMPYVDAIRDYGSDKPDLRFEMKIQDITNIFENTNTLFLKNILNENGAINCIVVKNASDKYSRKDLDKLTEFVKTYKAKSLAYLKYNGELTGSLKELSEFEKKV